MRTGLALLFVWYTSMPHSVHAYDPFETDVDAPWNKNTSTRFHPIESMSFAHVLFDGFDLKYADTADLRGYIGQDIVQLGHYYARTKFGCITRCDSADFNGVDGILGVGMPDAALASIPEPLMFAITDDTGDPVSQRILKDRKYTFVVDNDAGELNLGAYDHRAIAQGEKMHFFKTTSTAEYSVPITSIKYGDQELLDFATVINPRVPGRMSWIPGIIDSGTSCVVLPDSLLSGVLRKKPFSTFASLFFSNPLYDKTRKLPIFITIGQGTDASHTFKIPFESWWLASDHRPCVQTSPPGFMGILLGDVIFRSLVIQFDLTHPTVPIIGMAQRNRKYKPVRPGSSWQAHRPREADDFGIPEGYDDGAHISSGEVDKVPLDTGLATQIFVNISVGTPRQTLKVILDTGSSVFAVFCDQPPKKGQGPNMGHIYLPHFIPSFAQHQPSPLDAFKMHGRGHGRTSHSHDTGHAARNTRESALDAWEHPEGLRGRGRRLTPDAGSLHQIHYAEFSKPRLFATAQDAWVPEDAYRRGGAAAAAEGLSAWWVGMVLCSVVAVAVAAVGLLQATRRHSTPL